MPRAPTTLATLTVRLDPVHAEQIHDLINDLHNKPTSSGDERTTLVVTHDKDLLRRLEPEVVMLHEGRVFFDGSYEEFAASDSEIILPYFEGMPALHQRHLVV